MSEVKENSIEWFDKHLRDKSRMTESAGQMQITLDVIDYIELLHVARVMHQKETCRFAIDFMGTTDQPLKDFYNNTFGNYNE
jgi:hypothetical protein